MTNGGLAKSLGVNYKLVKNIADSFKPTYPESFKEYVDTSGNLFIHFSPNLVAMIKQKIKERGESAPEGWVTTGGLAVLLRVSSGFIEKIAEPFRSTHPQWFKKFLNKNKLFEYYHPNLVMIVRQRIKERGELAPEGWMTNGGVKKLLGGVSFRSVKATADAFRSTHPEWFKDYLDAVGNLSTHFSPDLIAIIKRGLKEKGESVPAGWMTNGGLATSLEVGFGLVEKIAEPFRSTHPQWFKKFLNKNKLFEYYHPNLVMIVRQRIKERGELAPEGWMTNGGVKKLLGGVSFRSVKATADAFRSTHPEWFKDYLDAVGNLSTHFSPDLIAIIKRGLKEKGESVPAGWMRNGGLATSLEVGFGLVEKIAEPFRSTHPQWFKKFLNKNKLFEYYHPNLVMIVRQRIKERGELAPEGWETKPRMAELLDVSHHLIKQVVEPFRITHPEWFKEYSDTTKRLAEYYHPDLVVLIKQSLKEIGEPAPAGWMTNGGLAASLKVSFGLVEKTVEPFRSTHPQWFKNHRDKSGHTNEHYHPDLIAKIKAEVVVLKRDRAEQEKRNQDQKNLDEFVKTIGEGKTPIAQQFQSLTRIFG